MRYTTLWLLAMLLTCGVPARAEIVEIPMPEFAGDYGYEQNRDRRDQGRIVVIDLQRPVANVNGAWMRWSGTVHAGWGICNGNPFRWAGGLAAKFHERGMFAWTAAIAAEHPDYDPVFNETTVFSSLLEPGWGFLADGTDSLIVSMYAAYYFCGEMGTPPTARIESATLVLDVEFVPVVTSPTTWGRIKALYAASP